MTATKKIGTNKWHYSRINIARRGKTHSMAFVFCLMLDSNVFVCAWRRRRWWRRGMKQMLSNERAFHARIKWNSRVNGMQVPSGKRVVAKCDGSCMSGFAFTVCRCVDVFYVFRLTDTPLLRFHLMGPKSTSKITLDASYFFSMSDRDYFLFILLCICMSTFSLSLPLGAVLPHTFWQIYLFQFYSSIFKSIALLS